MPISKDYQTVIYHTNTTNKEGRPTEQVRILMAPITENEEALLDKGRAFTIQRGDLTFSLCLTSMSIIIVIKRKMNNISIRY